jgi:hypothetical protein
MSFSESQFAEMTDEDTDTYFSRRVVTVPSGSLFFVYDAQTYANVKVSFVKRFKIFAHQIEPSNNDPVTTQLTTTNFKGLITNIANDYIEVTLRGTTVLDNLIEIQREVIDVAANCN